MVGVKWSFLLDPNIGEFHDRIGSAKKARSKRDFFGCEIITTTPVVTAILLWTGIAEYIQEFCVLWTYSVEGESRLVEGGVRGSGGSGLAVRRVRQHSSLPHTGSAQCHMSPPSFLDCFHRLLVDNKVI